MRTDDILKYAYILVALYCVTFLIGYLVPFQWKWHLLEKYKYSMAPGFRFEGSNRYMHILLHNIRADMVMLLTGLLFGIPTVIAIALHGYLDGTLLLHASSTIGFKNGVLAIYPHGIFEIIAMFISSSYGLWLGIMLIKRLKYGTVIDMKNKVIQALKINLISVIPLLILAAFIETYLTPHLYCRVP